MDKTEEPNRGRTAQDKEGRAAATGSLAREIILFSLTVALTSILEQLSNVIDTMMIGRLVGTDGMAAVGANTPVSSLLVNLFLGFSLGANVVIAQAVGADRQQEAQRATATAMTISIAGAAVTVLGILVSEPLLRALLVPSAILPDAVLFLRVYLIGMPAIFLYDMEAAALRATGHPALPLRALAVSAALNVVLDVLFIGVAGMGVAGSALGTVLCYTAGAIMLHRDARSTGLLGKRHISQFDARLARSIVAIGLPAGVQGAIFAFSNTIIQASINSLGKAAIAGSSAAMSVEFVAYSLINAFGQACSTYTGAAYGASDFRRCKRALATCITEGLCVSAILVTALLVGGREVLALFNSSQEVVALGYTRLVAVMPSYLLVVVYESMSGYMRGYGISTAPAVVTTTVVCGLRMFWAFLVFPTSPTFQTIVLATPVSLSVNALCITALLLVIRPSKRDEENSLAGQAVVDSASETPSPRPSTRSITERTKPPSA